MFKLREEEMIRIFAGRLGVPNDLEEESSCTLRLGIPNDLEEEEGQD